MTPILPEPPQPAAVFSRAINYTVHSASPTPVYSAVTDAEPDAFLPSGDAPWIRSYVESILEDASRLSNQMESLIDELPRIQIFRSQLETCLRSPAAKRRPLRDALIAQIRASVVPSVYLQEVLKKCGAVRHPDALDIGVDLMAGFGAHLEGLCRRHIAAEIGRWQAVKPESSSTDDVCYVLLRSLGRSTVDAAQKLALIEKCLTNGPRSIREAAVHALGDAGGPEAERLLRNAARYDADSAVRESAESLLSEWEN
jgi:hypothetical protein